MTRAFKLPIVIPAESMDNLLANVMAVANLRKPAGGGDGKICACDVLFQRRDREAVWGEDRELVASKKVATYDMAPEMSAEGIWGHRDQGAGDTAFDVIIVNFRERGHGGPLGQDGADGAGGGDGGRAAGTDLRAIKQGGGSMLITADHGNAEMLIDPADRWAAHGAYDESGAVYFGER